jgi:hypothetical protein
MFEHMPEAPVELPLVVLVDELLELLELLELHAASPVTSTVPTTMARNL